MSSDSIDNMAVDYKYFVDTHIHFWDRKTNALVYEWLDNGQPQANVGNIDGLRALRYSTEEFIAETRFHRVTKAVNVQAAFGTKDPVDETAWIQSLADKTGWPHALLAYCDLSAPDAEKQLERHLIYPLMRGLREIVSAEIFQDSSFRRGYKLLSKYNLMFFHEVEWQNMDKAIELVKSIPEVTFCLDQTRMPLCRSDEYYRKWKNALTMLAAYPNTLCKIASLGRGDPRWTTATLSRWVLAPIEAFGVDRCFFGSNWPEDRLFSGYGDLINAYREIISGFAPDEQEKLLSKNAERIFRI